MAARHIQAAAPAFIELIEHCGVVTLPKNRYVSLPVAITSIVVGQMLSGKVARVITSRIESCLQPEAATNSWELSEQQLRATGISNRKVRTLKEFGKVYDANPESVEAWRHLPYSALLAEVTAIWGLGEWSASMMAIFHFCHEDVFPESDATLQRALILLHPDYPEKRDAVFNADFASPYRSYLALYLWAAIDTNFFNRMKA